LATTRFCARPRCEVLKSYALKHLTLRSMSDANESHRSENQLIAALEAGEIDTRAFLLEARQLRDVDGWMSDELRDALFNRLPAIAAICGLPGPTARLTGLLATTQETDGILYTLVILDEQVIMFQVVGQHLGAIAYSRYAIDDVRRTSGGEVPVDTEALQVTMDASTQDIHFEEKALTYVQRYFETDQDGLWRCPWLPLLDGSFDTNRAEPVISFSAMLNERSPEVMALIPGIVDDTFDNAPAALRAMAFQHLYVVANYARSPPGAIRRQRNWIRRKHYLLMRALKSRGRATTSEKLARFLCRLCPEPQFRDIIGRL
jgi:hypothetical protein